jgi:helicase
LSSLANVRILKNYYAFLLTPHESNEVLSTKLLGYQGKQITGQIPQLRGEIIWFWKNNKFLRERYFRLQGRNRRIIPQSPDRVRTIYKFTKYLLLDQNLPSELKNGIRGYINDFQLNVVVKEFENCPYCQLLDRITLMSPKKYYKGLNNQNICQLCALQELQRELKGRGVHITPTIIRYLQILLQQSKNVPETLNILSGNQTYGIGSVIKEVEQLIGKYHAPTPLTDEKLKNFLPDYILNNLNHRNISTLLPTQVKALKSGLLNGKNLMIVAETSAGKTLIGEMAALRTILIQKRQVLYLAPLVALANTKYESFRKIFQNEGLKIGLRVGKSRINIKNRKSIPDSRNLKNKDIIVGTYEGIDQLLRSGQKFSNVGLVIVDEIQTLQEEDDRGPDLDGLITRLKLQIHPPQIIGLSATVGNPKKLANMLELTLVYYKGRPVPLEVHVLIVPSFLKKKDRIIEIVNVERIKRSKFGFKGQTIIFTNSRRKTKEIRDFLRNNGIRCANYHSGLRYGVRKRIEEEFDSENKLDAVSATYALGAGVDFPASTVIFESLQMGKDLLSDRANIFFQMMGRAGRLGKHDKGKVILLATPFPPNASTQMTELEIAMNLLNVSHENVEPEYDLNLTATQLLATLSCFQYLTYNRWKNSFSTLIGRTGNFDRSIDYLIKMGLVLEKNKDKFEVTKLGHAGALSFLTVKEIKFVKKEMETKIPRRNPIEIAIKMEPFEGIHLSPRLIGFLERTLKTKVTSRLFTSSALDLLDQASIKVQKLDPNVLKILMLWNQLFFNCDCKDRPYCDHGLININKLLIQLHLNKYNPGGITQYIDKKFGLYAYPGDILRWLESFLHRLEGIKKVVTALEIESIVQNRIGVMIKSIENPKVEKNIELTPIFPHPI